MENIKSPLNYTGNKYRILDQIKPYFPDHCHKFTDVFCGGATVGINVNADQVLFIDKNPRVISLLNFLSKSNFEKLVKKLEDKIQEYGLSYSNLNGYSHYFNIAKPSNKNNGLKKYNKEPFYRLRKDYNSIENKDSDEANLLLYLLLVYGFNNDLRFNSNGEYNLPCGKTDLNRNNLNKIKEFIERSKCRNFKFVDADFKKPSVQKEILSSDFLYFDPPYLITDAVYNESNGWSESDEEELLKLLSTCIEKNIPFVLSNVLSKNNGNIYNEPLKKWIDSHPNVEVIDIDYHYRSSSYNKKNRNSNEREIIVVFGANK